MSKKGPVFLGLSLLALAGAGFYAGNRIYESVITKRPLPDKPSSSEPRELREGRSFVKNHPERQDIFVDSIDFLKLHGILIPAKQDETPSRYAILFHAEHDEGASMGIFAKHYLEKGFTVLMPDLRGCGSSEGSYSGFGYDDRLDVCAWVYRIIKEDAKAAIVLHGLGAGACAVINACAEHLPDNVRAVVADSAFTDANTFFGHYIKYGTSDLLPVKLRLFLFRMVTKIRAGYDIDLNRPVEAVKHSKTPTLFLHADDDNVTPVRMCNELYTVAACTREYATFLNAAHLRSVVSDPDRYWHKVDLFIEKFYSA